MSKFKKGQLVKVNLYNTKKKSNKISFGKNFFIGIIIKKIDNFPSKRSFNKNSEEEVELYYVLMNNSLHSIFSFRLFNISSRKEDLHEK